MELHSLATGSEPTPAPRTYWVIPGKLLAGAYPGAPTPSEHRARIEALWHAGVRTFVNLMEQDETNNAGKPFALYENIVHELAAASQESAECQRFPIRDLDVPTQQVMGTLLAAIDRSMAKGSVTYVHCFGGVGRTGTAVCAWLYQRGLVNRDNMFTVLSAIRRADKLAGSRPAPETDKQRAFVKSYAENFDASATQRSRIVGCLLGGALGDAFGAPIEFMSLQEIREKYGAAGLREFAPYAGRLGAITDDTQMTLFTVEGILRSGARSAVKGISHPSAVVHHAYLRWAHTQSLPLKAKITKDQAWPDGWLVKERALHSRRAPGNTCMSALVSAVKLGALAENDSKGCGTVMRVAPAGLCWSANDLASAFQFGAYVSHLTHAHPTGYLAGGHFAGLFALVLEGRELREAIRDAMEPLRAEKDAQETLDAIERALRLVDAGLPPTPELVESLGEGWIAEEALSIALYCALVAEDFEHGVRLAANISGDSDSTASMTGQILGVIGGKECLPERWLEQLELRDVIEEIGSDFERGRSGRFDAELEWRRYPGW